MSLFGLRVARDHGSKLRAFPSLEAAQAALFKHRDECLAYLRQHYPRPLEFSADGLKAVEAWYFQNFAGGQSRAGELVRQHLEEALAVYFGEVLVRADRGFRWSVEPYVFTPGTFELAVCRPLAQIGITRETDLFATPNNERRESLYRRFKQYAG
jgi:hypothetical protein